MVAIDTSNSAAPRAVGRIISGMFNAAATLQSWSDARVTRKALSRLSVRELDDIGLCKGDIDNIASRAYR